MSEKVVRIYQVVIQTLLCVLLSLSAYIGRSICVEQVEIKQQLLTLKLNQVKILTLLNAEPIALKKGIFEYSDLTCVNQNNQKNQNSSAALRKNFTCKKSFLCIE